MTYLRLGDVRVTRAGSVNPAKHPDETFDLYSIPAYDEGQPESVAGSEIGSSKNAVLPDDVLLSRIVPHIRRAWVVGDMNGHRQIASGEWLIFRSPDVDSRYLRWMLVSDPFHVGFMQTVAGVGGSLLRARPTLVDDLQIPLPPLPEQERIAAILDAADALRVKRRVSLELLDKLVQSVFLDMFGDPVTNPKGWEVVGLHRIAAIQGGLQVSSKRKNHPIERPYLRVANVYRAQLNLDEIKHIRATANEVARTELRENDLLIVEGHGNRDEIGRCARWDGSIEGCLHQNHLIRVRCDQSVAHPTFVEAYINSEPGRRHLTGLSRTTSGLNTISVSKVKSLLILLPPLAEQAEYAHFVETISRHRQVLESHLAELDTLFASLQSRAFRGEL